LGQNETQTLLQRTVGYSWHYALERSTGKSDDRTIEKLSLGGHVMTKDEAFDELSKARVFCDQVEPS
jgi:hypothetical protein